MRIGPKPPAKEGTHEVKHRTSDAKPQTSGDVQTNQQLAPLDGLPADADEAFDNHEMAGSPEDMRTAFAARNGIADNGIADESWSLFITGALDDGVQATPARQPEAARPPQETWEARVARDTKQLERMDIGSWKQWSAQIVRDVDAQGSDGADSRFTALSELAITLTRLVTPGDAHSVAGRLKLGATSLALEGVVLPAMERIAASTEGAPQAQMHREIEVHTQHADWAGPIARRYAIEDSMAWAHSIPTQGVDTWMASSLTYINHVKSMDPTIKWKFAALNHLAQALMRIAPSPASARSPHQLQLAHQIVRAHLLPAMNEIQVPDQQRAWCDRQLGDVRRWLQKTATGPEAHVPAQAASTSPRRTQALPGIEDMIAQLPHAAGTWEESEAQWHSACKGVLSTIDRSRMLKPDARLAYYRDLRAQLNDRVNKCKDPVYREKLRGFVAEFSVNEMLPHAKSVELASPRMKAGVQDFLERD